MKQIVLDFETYYDKDYSLRKMTPVEYILDPRFEVIGCAVKEDDQPAFWVEERGLVQFLAGLPDRVAVISHNALFDMCILRWKFGYNPTLMIDTLGMARAWLGHRLKSLALSRVAMHYGLQPKGDTVHKVVGMSKQAIIEAGFYDEYAEYSKGDAEICWDAYRKMIDEGFPVSEIAVMDTVIRCATEPKFRLDENLLAEHLHNTITEKNELMSRLGGLTKEDLRSNDKFAELLRQQGVDPPMKISLTTGKETYAFAKTDQAFMELEEHENPLVQALVCARLGVKSTIEETRTERFQSIARLTWPSNSTGWMPVPLRYSGAHTHRLSGDWKLNLQNLPSRGNNKLRQAIIAPDGHKVVAVDASQIEARIAGWLAGARGLVNAFANREDVYSSFAGKVFGYEVNKKQHPTERFIGKTAVLGLQYGLGWSKFQTTVAMQSKAQVGTEIVLDDLEATRVVQTYRNEYSEIPALWRYLNNMLPAMAAKTAWEEYGPIRFEKQSIRLPNGLYLHYHDLEYKDEGWWFTYGGKPKYVYGGKMTENIVQALARICVMDTAVKVRKMYGYELALQVHDELVYVLPEDQAELARDRVIEVMSQPPAWGPDIPLAAEGDVADSYGDAK